MSKRVEFRDYREGEVSPSEAGWIVGTLSVYVSFIWFSGILRYRVDFQSMEMDDYGDDFYDSNDEEY